MNPFHAFDPYLMRIVPVLMAVCACVIDSADATHAVAEMLGKLQHRSSVIGALNSVDGLPSKSAVL
jgi:hypothetical protein